MRKFLLLSLCLLGTYGVIAQSSIPNLEKAFQNNLKDKKEIKQINTPYSGNEVSLTSSEIVNCSPAAYAKEGVGDIIGTTTYDLQTNNSVARRIALDADGNKHIVFTYSQTFDIGAIDRGTGYNMVSADGTIGEAPTSALESDRNGWPNIGITESGRIVNVAHYAGGTASFGGLVWSYKDPGDADWTVMPLPVGNGEDTWARLAVSGNSVHIIASRQQGEGQEICGLLGGLTYLRSTDGGDTWDDPICIDGMDNSTFPRLRGDSYAIDASGDNVAFVCGTYQPYLFKSTDGGDSWTNSAIMDFPDPFYDPVLSNSLIPMSVSTDESYSLILDDDGMAHVWFGRQVIEDDGEAGSWLPANNGIMYWSEYNANDNPKIMGKTVRQDMDGDGDALFDFNESDPNLYFSNQVSHPSAGIDADGNLYLAYSSIVEGHVDENSNHFRDIFLLKSEDKGSSWVGPINVTDNPTAEDVFASIARTVTDQVHLVYMTDELPGMAVQGAETPYGVNEIRYIGVPVSDIVNPTEEDSTNPQLVVLSAPFGFENCDYNIGEIEGFAIDYPDGEIEINATGDLLDNIATPGDTYSLEIIAEDSAGNSSTELFDSNMIVYADEFAPEIYVLGCTIIDVIVGTEFIEPDVEVLDDATQFGCPPTLTINNPVNIDEVGNYEVVYQAVDINGNEAEEVILPVNVIAEDTTDPEIYLLTGLSGADSLAYDMDEFYTELVNGAAWVDPGYVALDNVECDLSANVVIGGDEVDLETVGSYNVTYTITDASGNSTTITRVVVVQDTQAPTINLSGPATIVWSCGTDFTEPGFSAFDNADGNITADVETSVSIDGIEIDEICTTWEGTYIITYSVSDASGNPATITRNVIIPTPCSEFNCVIGIKGEPDLEQVIQIGPNPSDGRFVIDLSKVVSEEINIDLYNIGGGGTIIDFNTTEKSDVEIDLTDYPSGIYLLNITDGQSSISKKLVKR